MPTSSATGKELKLGMTRATAQFGFWTIQCVTALRVETAEGFSKDFQGDAASSRGLFPVTDVCVGHAVAEALKDPTIVEYLQQRPPPATQ